MDRHHLYMSRCLELAIRAAGHTAPNPMVGAVLVHSDRIIGEGYHEAYGQAHAEVNCLASVSDADRHLITESTLYVSLEPCAHFGKTPPCADLVIRHGIPRVVVGAEDPFPEVAGKGIVKLKEANIAVTILEGEAGKPARWLNRRFFTYHQQQRPYVILKWAETADGYIGRNSDRVAISNAVTNRLVHRWRSEESAILIGAGTAIADDPVLDNRYWHGRPPMRVLLDSHLHVPSVVKILSDGRPTIVINDVKEADVGAVRFVKQDRQAGIAGILASLMKLDIQSVLVEGGARILQSFIDSGLWDETRIIRNTELVLGDGIPSPKISNALVSDTMQIAADLITTLKKTTPGG